MDVTGGDNAKHSKSEKEYTRWCHVFVEYRRSKVSDKAKKLTHPRRLTVELRLPKGEKREESKEGTQWAVLEDSGCFGVGCGVVVTPQGGDPILLTNI